MRTMVKGKKRNRQYNGRLIAWEFGCMVSITCYVTNRFLFPSRIFVFQPEIQWELKHTSQYITHYDEEEELGGKQGLVQRWSGGC